MCYRKQNLGTCWIALSFVIMVAIATSCLAQPAADSVLMRRGEGREDLWRRGAIVAWEGDSLQLESNQRIREIPNHQIVQIQTHWPEVYVEALQAIDQGNFQAALGLLAKSLDVETRGWAKQIMRADLVRVSLATGRLGVAHSQFKSIMSEDPRSRFVSLLPLKWSSGGRYDLNFAIDLLDSNDGMDQLFAASWLLDGSHRTAATKVMENLANDIDARISRLATVQLWRLRLSNMNSVNERQLAIWQRQIDELPSSLRAGPYYFLGDLYSRLGNADTAALYWMRVPILYPENLHLSAAALYQTSILLQKKNQTEEARSLQAELKLKYPESIWAQQL